jgi:hypothetical protein
MRLAEELTKQLKAFTTVGAVGSAETHLIFGELFKFVHGVYDRADPSRIA